MRIPDKVIGFKVYADGESIGTADIELPSIEFMTETLTGAGIAGEIETPALGQIASMTTTLNFRALDKSIGLFLDPKGIMIDCRGAIQHYETQSGQPATAGVKVTMKLLPKSTSLGKFEVGATGDTSTENEVAYLKILIDNKEVVEIDKANYICRINGVDHLEEVRNQLGM